MLLRPHPCKILLSLQVQHCPRLSCLLTLLTCPISCLLSTVGPIAVVYHITRAHSQNIGEVKGRYSTNHYQADPVGLETVGLAGEDAAH